MTQRQPMPHDSIVREFFTEPPFVEEILRFILPRDIAQTIDMGALIQCSEHLNDDEGTWGITDFLFKTRFKQAPIPLYLMLEHQSDDDHWMAPRIVHNICRLWDIQIAGNREGKTIAIVLAMVLAHPKRPWAAAHNIQDLIDGINDLPACIIPAIPRWSHFVADLRSMTNEHLMNVDARASTWFFLLTLRNGRDPNIVRMIKDWRPLLVEAGKEPGGLRAKTRLVRYLEQVVPNLTQEALMFIAKTAEIEPEWYKDTLAYKLREEARRQVREEGREEGRREARAEALAEARAEAEIARREAHEEAEKTRREAADRVRRFLMVRLSQIVSPPPLDVIDRVYKAELRDLEVWMERALTSADLSEIFQ